VRLSLAAELAREVPADPDAAAFLMVERYWSVMLENKLIYRLMNGVDGAPVDRERVNASPQRSFDAAKAMIQSWLVAECHEAADADLLLVELWAVIHGMAALYLDRSSSFDLCRAQGCALGVVAPLKLFQHLLA